MSVVSSGWRSVKRGGGSDGDHEYVGSRDTSSCNAFCNMMMMAGGVGWESGGNTRGEDPYHIKCYDAFGTFPLNGVRVAFPSQLGTTNIDPALPKATPMTNVTACKRVLWKLSSFEAKPFKR